MKLVRKWLLAALILIPDPGRYAAAQMFPRQFRGIGIEQRLGGSIPLDTVFRDESGASVPLRSYFTRKPVLLVPVYYRCQTLCSQVLNGLVAGLSPLPLRAGRDFEVVAFSFNPDEVPADARVKLDQCTMNYAGSRGAPGWHFLTGSSASIRILTQAIGFHYSYDPVTKMFVHASGILIATPQGRIAHYLYGVTYEPKDLEMGLIESSHGQTGSAVDRILLLCYPYNPATGKYGAIAMSLLRSAAVAMLLLMTVSLILLWRFDLRRHRQNVAPRSKL